MAYLFIMMHTPWCIRYNDAYTVVYAYLAITVCSRNMLHMRRKTTALYEYRNALRYIWLHLKADHKCLLCTTAAEVHRRKTRFLVKKRRCDLFLSLSTIRKCFWMLRSRPMHCSSQSIWSLAIGHTRLKTRPRIYCILVHAIQALVYCLGLRSQLSYYETRYCICLDKLT